MILIGSKALNHHLILKGHPGLVRSSPSSDFDFIATQEEIADIRAFNLCKEVLETFGYAVEEIETSSGVAFKIKDRDGHLSIIDFEVATQQSAAFELLQRFNSAPYPSMIDMDGKVYLSAHIADPALLYTLKMSHRFKKNSPHFGKTRKDILMMRDVFGFQFYVPNQYEQFYDLRCKQTYNYSHPSLKRSKDEFFSGDGVNYVYDHDTIHEAIKLFDRPAFEYFREDGADVFCSKKKFFDAPVELQLATVYEEVTVLALERSQIPSGYTIPPAISYAIALEKVCTSIASGWWRTFAWENYDKITSMYRKDYVDTFLNALAQGTVKPHNVQVTA